MVCNSSLSVDVQLKKMAASLGTLWLLTVASWLLSAISASATHVLAL